jgi:hypothetical protein
VGPTGQGRVSFGGGNTDAEWIRAGRGSMLGRAAPGNTQHAGVNLGHGVRFTSSESSGRS